MKSKLNEVLSEGLLDSVLPYLVPANTSQRRLSQTKLTGITLLLLLNRTFLVARIFYFDSNRKVQLARRCFERKTRSTEIFGHDRHVQNDAH